jgi:Elongation factor 1 gamma, conserved domain
MWYCCTNQIYSNTSDYDACMKQFWEIYDPEGWSLWICRYKYNEENKKVFMTSNLVSPVYSLTYMITIVRAVLHARICGGSSTCNSVRIAYRIVVCSKWHCSYAEPYPAVAVLAPSEKQSLPLV